jgi:hypothetical protein
MAFGAAWEGAVALNDKIIDIAELPALILRRSCATSQIGFVHSSKQLSFLPRTCMIGSYDPAIGGHQPFALHTPEVSEQALDLLFRGLVVLLADQVSILDLCTDQDNQVCIHDWNAALRHARGSMMGDYQISHFSFPFFAHKYLPALRACFLRSRNSMLFRGENLWLSIVF